MTRWLLVLSGCMAANHVTPTDAAAIDRVQAATQTAEGNATCSGIAPFYWEIGDANAVIASGAVGSGVEATTTMAIASASKWLFGAYVVERSAIDVDAMTMRSGYTNLTYASCIGTSTVEACLNAGNNGAHTAANDGLFYYNGGHFQKYAVTLGLGAMDNAALAAELQSQLGSELDFSFGSPQLAGGVQWSAQGYATFLRKILSGALAIHDQLGANAVCTVCPAAVYSPAPAPWHYSYAHWMEDDPSTGDGAFSSPGAFGFYPWIDATRSYYGIVARHSLVSAAYIQSAECGRLIRKAFATGLVQ